MIWRCRKKQSFLEHGVGLLLTGVEGGPGPIIEGSTFDL